MMPADGRRVGHSRDLSASELGNEDVEELSRLEESLWRAEVRFNLEKMEEILAEDFFEFGRSSRVYTRQEVLGIPAEKITAVLPLTNLRIRLLSSDVAQVTYTSIVTYADGVQRGRRSSIWSRSPQGWKLRFHQGTAIPDTPHSDGVVRMKETVGRSI